MRVARIQRDNLRHALQFSRLSRCIGRAILLKKVNIFCILKPCLDVQEMSRAADEPKINALKVSTQGQVTLSKEARQQQGINAGDTLIEISLPGCLVLLPQSAVLSDLMLRAQQGLKKLGLTPEELKDNVSKRRKSRLSQRYPGVFDGKT